MHTCCHLIGRKLPPQAWHWLQVSSDYRVGRITSQELDVARVAAWKYLGPQSCNFSSPEVNAVRAVICLMFPDNRNDWYDSLCVFLEFCNDAENHQEEQCQLIRELFKEKFI
jgi:hypothetical protein